jgi:hypothetical protein
MYATMGVEGCVAYSDSEYVELAVSIGTNRTKEANLRRDILANVHKLYNNPEVVREWEEFIDYAVSNPRPEVNSGVETAPTSGIDQNHASIELPGVELGYAIKLATDTGDNVFVRLSEHDDPLSYAQQVGDVIGAEYVKYRWIATVLQRGLNRLRYSDVIHTFLLEVNNERVKVDVRYGDDLTQLAMFTGLRRGLNDAGIGWLASVLEERVPEFATREWIDFRYSLDKLNRVSRTDTSDSSIDGDGSNFAPVVQYSERNPAELAGGCYLTLAFTTCKRLPTFLQTATSLMAALGGGIPRNVVCEVLVIDDSSSSEDRLAMQRMFPEFSFVFKPDGERGHANSMNLIRSLVKTRYLMYLEDDWNAMEGVGVKQLVHDPMEVLLHDETLMQVLLNDQSSRECAEVRDVAACVGDPAYGRSGWAASTRNGVEYMVHEFGSLRDGHSFTYWPGFSLNPSIIDLMRLDEVCGGPFDVGDDRFEQSFSVRCYEGGGVMGYMKGRTVMKHEGVVSSYVLNGEIRPFDNVREVELNNN